MITRPKLDEGLCIRIIFDDIVALIKVNFLKAQPVVLLG
jgi:hypothetical protein